MAEKEPARGVHEIYCCCSKRTSLGTTEPQVVHSLTASIETSASSLTNQAHLEVLDAMI